MSAPPAESFAPTRRIFNRVDPDHHRRTFLGSTILASLVFPLRSSVPRSRPGDTVDRATGERLVRLERELIAAERAVIEADRAYRRYYDSGEAQDGDSGWWTAGLEILDRLNADEMEADRNHRSVYFDLVRAVADAAGKGNPNLEDWRATGQPHATGRPYAAVRYGRKIFAVVPDLDAGHNCNQKEPRSVFDWCALSIIDLDAIGGAR